METHRAAVEAIAARVRHFYDTKTAFRVYHGSTNSTRHAGFDRDAIVDVSGLNRVLSIDRERMVAVVEPNVPMDGLVGETLKDGLLPPVVMEFPGITVGGGFVGTAGESSSFKYGFFDRTVLSVEVVLADGEVVKASPTENQELFEGLRGSFGTLGVLTLVEVQLIEVGRYVEVNYIPTHSFEHATQTLQQETRKPDIDYVDGILFSKSSGVIVTGRLTTNPASASLPIRHFSRPWNEWFWIHAKSLCSAANATPTTELVPIQDYLFRYDRGAFWTGMYAFRHFMVPFTWLTRLLLDYFMHTRIMYHALHASGHTDRYIIQDIAFPAANTTSFIKWVDQNLGLYPLWLCPLRNDARSSMGHARRRDGSGGDSPYINVGVWGPYPSPEAEYVRMNRALENKTHELSGLKWLYGRVFYTDDEWWNVYDQPAYDALRRKYRATSLPTVWEKVRDRGSKKVEREPGFKGLLKRIVKGNGFLSGVYGVWKALGGGDYLLGRKKKVN
ncbi:FAD-binding domain-containing protein [Periconia macrospinosa]|uniref:Delta(24)-sterol reductase n=1 Tax=Periconia macrospinosa TaxID=97972 RepID=A0A2V1DU21_9PLEO|nr:FAD-binding domain-containing protein [Periconia macrospinosa]